MESTLDYLPADKQHELRSIDETIRRLCKDVEMVILFGSYARGDYREEKDLSPQRKSGHVSDYDILVVTQHKATALDVGIWDEITRQVNVPGLSAPVKIITHDIQELNIKLAEGQYFYTDIRKEGRVLYDSGRYTLSEPGELSDADRQRIAQDHFDHWFQSAQSFMKNYRFNCEQNDHRMAAFMLHQAAEASYKTLLLVFTNYNPNEHLLDLLIAQTSEFSPELKDVFPRSTQEEKDLFGLLDYAYIGARYDPGYQISPSGLEYLASRVKMLMAVVESTCKQKIAGIGE